MAYADKLFGAFQRLHSATEYAGTGIGLRPYSASCTGTAGASGPKGKSARGPCFFFTLAIAGEEAAAAEPVEEKAHG